MRDVIGAIACAAALSGCGQSVPDPSSEEVGIAMRSVLQTMPLTMWFGPFGEATDCTDGMMDGVSIRSCKVCSTHVQLMRHQSPYGMSNSLQSAEVRRANFHVNFKRAISFEQPDIAPAEGGAGVWVAALPVRTAFSAPSPPTFEQVAGRPLTPNDPLPGDMVMEPRGNSVTFNIRRPGYLGIFANYGVLLNELSRPDAVRTFIGIVGTCDAPAAPDF